MMNKIQFVKFTAAGNDFVIFEGKNLKEADLPESFHQSICNRRFGVGADGVLIVSPSEDMDFDVQYFNADGSSGSLCGNGARSAVKYWQTHFAPKRKDFQFSFAGKAYLGNIINSDEVKIKLNAPDSIRRHVSNDLGGLLITGDYADTGSPHFVADVHSIFKNDGSELRAYSELAEVPVVELGRKLRYSGEFAPEGVNVNFIELSGGLIKIRSYERGVEDETLACGTGAVAAAILFAENYKLESPVLIKTAGGDLLKVDFIIDNQTVNELFLQGPVKQIFEGIYSY